MPAMLKLSAKQEAFCVEYVVDLDAVAAALRAGYAPASAKTSAYKSLQKPHVVARIAELKRGGLERTKVNADWLLLRLADEADADINDLYDENTGALKPVRLWPKIWRTGLVSGVEVEQQFAYQDGNKIPDGVVTKIKLSDRVKRLELIGRHVSVGAFGEDRDKAPTQINITINRPAPDSDGD